MTDSIMDVMWGWEEDSFSELERKWASGWHEDQNGKKWRLKDMTDFHLKNTINYFNDHDCDISPLLKQAKKRKLLINIK